MCQPPLAPGAVPAPAVSVAALPQREVERALLALVDADARARRELVDVAAREQAVVLEARDAEVDVGARSVDRRGARHAIGDLFSLELDDERDDLVHVRRHARLDVGARDAERGHVFVVRVDEARGVLGRILAALVRARDDLVVDVREVADVLDLERSREPPAHDVERDVHARVADVREVVGRDAADVHADLARHEGHQVLFVSAQRVEDPDRHRSPRTFTRACNLHPRRDLSRRDQAGASSSTTTRVVAARTRPMTLKSATRHATTSAIT